MRAVLFYAYVCPFSTRLCTYPQLYSKGEASDVPLTKLSSLFRGLDVSFVLVSASPYIAHLCAIAVYPYQPRLRDIISTQILSMRYTGVQRANLSRWYRVLCVAIALWRHRVCGEQKTWWRLTECRKYTLGDHRYCCFFLHDVHVVILRHPCLYERLHTRVYSYIFSIACYTTRDDYRRTRSGLAMMFSPNMGNSLSKIIHAWRYSQSNIFCCFSLDTSWSRRAQCKGKSPCESLCRSEEVKL